MRGFARILGPCMIATGLIFFAVGIADFFQAFGGDGPPTKFWCCFVGGPMIGVGVGITVFAYLKPIANYVVGESREAVSTFSSAVAPGRGGSTPPARAGVALVCPACASKNAPGARFCNNCGVPLAKSDRCSNCNERNAPDANFCVKCETALS